MLSDLRVPYYPDVQMSLVLTPHKWMTAEWSTGKVPYLGESKSSYEFCRVDCISVLKSKLGNEVFRDRDRVFRFLSRKGLTPMQWKAQLLSYISRFSDVSNYVDEVMAFRREDMTLAKQITYPLLEMVIEYAKQVTQELKDKRAKILFNAVDMIDGYVYFSLSNNRTVKDMNFSFESEVISCTKHAKV